MEKQLRFQISCIVWGETYCQLLLDYCLPSLLAKGNIPDWPYLSQTNFILYTHPSDWQTIARHPALQRLRNYLSVEPLLIKETELNTSKYEQFTSITQTLINRVATRGVSLIFINPDHVFSAHSLTALAHQIEAGKDIVATMSPRVSREQIQASLKTLVQEHSLTLEPATCVDWFYRYMHPLAQSLFIDSPHFAVWPSQNYRWLNPYQMEAHCFHLHPIFIRNPMFLPNPATIDGEYLRNHGNLENIKVMDNNELFVLSLTADPEHQDQLINNFKDYQTWQVYLDRFRRLFCQPIHLFFFQHPIRLTGSQPLGKEPSVPPELLQSVGYFWEIEKLYHQGQYERLIDLFNHHQEVIQTYLNHPPFNVIFYFLEYASQQRKIQQ